MGRRRRGRPLFGLVPPDSLLPDGCLLLAYGAFFAAGWTMHRHTDLLALIRRRCAWNLALAVIAAAVMLRVLAAAAGNTPAGALWLAWCAGCALLMWTGVWAVLGLCLRFLPRPSAALRYVSDASCWLYLMHLRPVMFLQVALADVPWHWSLKLALIHALVIPPPPAAYHWLVRPTFIGAVLNGRRRPRRAALPERSVIMGAS